MAPLKVLSLNVRGLDSKFKRSLVFSYLKKYHSHICILKRDLSYRVPKYSLLKNPGWDPIIIQLTFLIPVGSVF